jgi:hypothetical protein
MVRQCPYMINQIRLQTFRNVAIRELNIRMQKLRPSSCSSLWLNQVALKFPSTDIEAIRMLCLNLDHVVHDHTTCHHLMHGLQRSCSSWVMNNSPPRLEYIDDTIIFEEHDIEKALNMKLILCIFKHY